VFEIRIHGRGGQGVVTAAELLAAAAFAEGRFAQAFPSFGSERTGAPVVSFCRIDDKPIRTREPVMRPDALIIGDPTLLHQVSLFEGAGGETQLLINSARGMADLGIGDLTGMLAPGAAVTVPATDLAQRHLGRPVPNAALVGGFAALTGLVSEDSLLAAIAGRFSGAVAEGNAAAAREAYAAVAAQAGRSDKPAGPVRGSAMAPDRADAPAFARSRGPTRSPAPSRCAGPRSSAPTRSPRRPTSSRR